MIRKISAFNPVCRRSGTRRSISSRWRNPAFRRSILRCKKPPNGWLNKEVRIRGDWTVNNPHPEGERLGLRIQQRLLSRHRRHRDGADGAAAGSAERSTSAQ